MSSVRSAPTPGRLHRTFTGCVTAKTRPSITSNGEHKEASDLIGRETRGTPNCLNSRVHKTEQSDYRRRYAKNQPRPKRCAKRLARDGHLQEYQEEAVNCWRARRHPAGHEASQHNVASDQNRAGRFLTAAHALAAFQARSDDENLSQHFKFKTKT